MATGIRIKQENIDLEIREVRQAGTQTLQFILEGSNIFTRKSSLNMLKLPVSRRYKKNI
jgi:hypothetical protein